MNLSKLIKALTIHKSQHPSLLKSTCPGLHLQGLQLRPPLVHSALSLCQGMKLSIVIILKGFHYPLLRTPKPTNCLQKLSISAIHSYSATRFHHGRLSSAPVDSHSETSEDSWQSQVSRQKERFLLEYLLLSTSALKDLKGNDLQSPDQSFLEHLHGSS